ncbi:MAG: Ig-like domain-containing protein, partial [Marinoscillum sp.]
AAPANDADNLVAAYGALKAITDNQLRDLTDNGHNGTTSHETIIVTTEEAEIPDYDASVHYTISWKMAGTEFDTDATGNINIEEGISNYNVVYGTPFFQKTEEFSLSYTNLLPSQPLSKTVANSASVIFEVDEIDGANYQWYKVGFGTEEISSGSNGIPSTILFNDVKESNGIVYLGTRDGLNISSNGGESFTTISSSTAGFGSKDDVKSLAVNGDKVYAIATEFLNISDDQGETWRNIDISDEVIANLSINDIQVINDEIHLAGVANTVGYYIKSDDAGVNWSLIQPSFTSSSSNLSDNFKSIFVDGETVLITVTSVGGATTKVGGLLISEDGGNSWERKVPGEDGYPSGNHFQSVLKKNGTIYLGGSDGLYLSNDDGDTWVSGDDLGNYKNTRVNEFALVGNRVYVSSSGVQFTDDNGQNWIDLDDDFNNRLRSIAISDTNIYGISLEGQNDLLFILNDKELLEDEADNSADNQIQGATTRKLTISNLNLDENDSEYYMVVSKDGCDQQSNEATLTVVEAPIIEELSPVNGYTDVEIDENLEIGYTDQIGLGTGTVSVYKYATDELVRTFSTEVQQGPETELYLAGGGSNLYSQTMNLEYYTKYYVLVDYGVALDGNDNPSLAITDKDFWTFSTECEPLILTQPEDQSGIIGGSVTFLVPEVSGATYQGLKNEDKTTNIDLE